MNLLELSRDSTPSATLHEHLQVAPIAVEVEQVGEEMHDAQRLLLDRRDRVRHDRRGNAEFAFAWGRDLSAIGALHQCGADRRQRRVVRDRVHVPIGGHVERGVDHIVHAIDESCLDAGIFQAQRQIVLACAAGIDHELRLACELFEIAVPDP